MFGSCVVMAFLAVVLTDCRGKGKSWEINEEAIVITQEKRRDFRVLYLFSAFRRALKGNYYKALCILVFLTTVPCHGGH